MAEYAYTQKNNEVKVQFQEDGAAKDLTGATKIAVEFFSTVNDPMDRIAPIASMDSVNNAALFDLTDIVNGNLTFKPDDASLTPLTTARYYGRFIVYAASYPLGRVWAKAIDDLFVFIVGV